METNDRGLDELFRLYREACPAPEPSASFVPGIWQKIEARQSSWRLIQRWAQALVAASAVLSALLVVHSMWRARVESPVYTTTYVDTLAGPEPLEIAAFTEMAAYTEASWRGTP